MAIKGKAAFIDTPGVIPTNALTEQLKSKLSALDMCSNQDVQACLITGGQLIGGGGSGTITNPGQTFPTGEF